MIKIAFCDDEVSVLRELRSLLEQYQAQCGRPMDCAAFQSPVELMAQIEKGVRFDVLFLDIIMPGGTGLKVAQEIRGFDSNVKIVFLTSSSEYAVQSYAVEAFYYQLKPIRAEEFFRLMDSAVCACEKERGSSLILRCKSGITRIELSHLEYCEVIHRTLFLHLTDGRVLESTGSLDEFSKWLEPYGQFLRPHRSYLVNMEYIEHLSYKTITMSHPVQIPIPRGKYQQIKDKYLAYAFRNRQVVL